MLVPSPSTEQLIDRFSTSTRGQLPAQFLPTQGIFSQIWEWGECYSQMSPLPQNLLPPTWDCASQHCHNRAVPSLVLVTFSPFKVDPLYILSLSEDTFQLS